MQCGPGRSQTDTRCCEEGIVSDGSRETDRKTVSETEREREREMGATDLLPPGSRSASRSASRVHEQGPFFPVQPCCHRGRHLFCRLIFLLWKEVAGSWGGDLGAIRARSSSTTDASCRRRQGLISHYVLLCAMCRSTSLHQHQMHASKNEYGFAA